MFKTPFSLSLIQRVRVSGEGKRIKGNDDPRFKNRVVKETNFIGGVTMRKWIGLVMCFMFIGEGVIFAEPLKRHTFELKPEISYIVYKEPDVMKEKGMMYGLAGSYTFRQKLMLKVEGRGSFGKVDYSNSGKMNNITDYMLEFRGLGGWDFILLSAITMTPYIGIGYRYLNDDSGGKVSSTGALGYERESNYIYSPLGMAFIIDLGNGWSTLETIEYDLFWWGKQKSHLSDADPGLNDVSNRQKNGNGLRGSLTLQKKVNKIDIEVGPFIRYWRIKKSETKTITYYGIPIGYGWEPKNRSTEIGILGAIKF
jgi:hypothetical protein